MKNEHSPKKAAIYGATGYTGVELARLLLGHPFIELSAVHSRSFAGKDYQEVFGNLRGFHSGLICEEASIEEFAERYDVVFLALPHGIASGEISAELCEKTLFVDLGADFRLSKQDEYERWYGVEHGNPELLPSAVYGLCELYRDRIAEGKLIANPGCYTTASILSLAPLMDPGLIDSSSIIIDAKSGVSGAGRKTSLPFHFVESNETLKAYKVEGHRHIPEIEENLTAFYGSDITVRFTPHLVPMNRGILITAYLRPRTPIDTEKLGKIYRDFYKDETFVRILEQGVFPETRWLRGSNFVDISPYYDERSETIIVVGALDNLVKGASGQAVQNMNIRLGFEETEGLMSPPLFP